MQVSAGLSEHFFPVFTYLFVLCRLAAQVSQYYTDIEELDSIQQLRKYLGQVKCFTIPLASESSSGLS